MQGIMKWGVVGLALGLACAPTLAAKKAASASAQAATIVNTGSTNTTGYKVMVMPSGQVRYAVTGRAGGDNAAMQAGHVAKSQARRLFLDIAAASPLDQLPVSHTFKSVSFGTSTYIEYAGKRTPDLSAPADPRGQALLSDMQAIAASLNLKNGPRRPIAPVAPSPPGQ